MQKLSIALLKKKLPRYPHLSELEIFVMRIKKEDPEFIMLYGSLARGNYTQFSDIDVLCVFNQEFKTPRERFLKAYRCSDGLVQTKTYSLTEFQKNIENGNSFLLKIIAEGFILLSKIPDKKIKKWIELGKINSHIAYFAPY
ncbi:hypothetical protein LCGC14_0779610 [marine sediment metagenome]|uniref:Polymerase nucleotidyl transferase domain-containing protein n=1 Tax=marine sediment metagenome TaxID=412755 RepID=A0A0F9Q051_9ZZZZ|nr:MAG: Nucleotidyltransferase domain protein [Candidatus Lokiarchaeum sp. GC14_75]HEA71162.1 nucleotidyltransferase domain-containing protein [archaeon]